MKVVYPKRPFKCRGCNTTFEVGTKAVYTSGCKETHFVCEECITAAHNNLKEGK